MIEAMHALLLCLLAHKAAHVNMPHVFELLLLLLLLMLFLLLLLLLLLTQYNWGIFAPGIREGEAAGFRCGHNLLRAHAAVYDLYHRKPQVCVVLCVTLCALCLCIAWLSRNMGCNAAMRENAACCCIAALFINPLLF
jgi:hypothetical protein